MCVEHPQCSNGTTACIDERRWVNGVDPQSRRDLAMGVCSQSGRDWSKSNSGTVRARRGQSRSSRSNAKVPWSGARAGDSGGGRVGRSR